MFCFTPGVYVAGVMIVTFPRGSEFAGANVWWHAAQFVPPSIAAPVRLIGGPVLNAITTTVVAAVAQAVVINLTIVCFTVLLENVGLGKGACKDAISPIPATKRWLIPVKCIGHEKPEGFSL